MFSRVAVSHCPICNAGELVLAHEYKIPPEGEVVFEGITREDYRRQYWRCACCGHFVSDLRLDTRSLYTGDYVASNYGGLGGIRGAYRKIRSLPPEKSDNVGRVWAVVGFAQQYFAGRQGLTLLDIGAGLGVFPAAIQESGFMVTALDPDKDAVEHLSGDLGLLAIHGAIEDLSGVGPFDLVTLNKVLEHVNDPVAMLRRAAAFCRAGGLIYIELPDGESALAEGFGREEFFIDHLHVFSQQSGKRLVEKTGMQVLAVERLREPSTKYTLRIFCTI